MYVSVSSDGGRAVSRHEQAPEANFRLVHGMVPASTCTLHSGSEATEVSAAGGTKPGATQAGGLSVQA